MFEDVAAARLRAGGRRLALRNMLMCSSKQPERPTRRTKAHQQHQDAFGLNHAATFPIEHVALTILERTLLPPAAGIFGQALLRSGKIRDDIPDRRAKALPDKLVDTDVDASFALLPDPHLGQIPALVGAFVDLFERHPALGRMLNLRAFCCPKDVIPLEVIETGQKWLTRMHTIGKQHNPTAMGQEIINRFE